MNEIDKKISYRLENMCVYCMNQLKKNNYVSLEIYATSGEGTITTITLVCNHIKKGV